MAPTLVQSLATPTHSPSRRGGWQHAQWRGACPGLSAPLLTGDGLLARFLPIGTIPLVAFKTLCATARTHGNGIVEITARGSIQVRGLRSPLVQRFADAVAALGIAAADCVPVHCNALAGLDSGEILDSGTLAANLRGALAQTSVSARLAPKVSVVLDGGGSLTLDSLSADLRLCAEATDRGVVFRVGIGGDGARAMQIGAVVPANGVETAMRVLEVIARRGRNWRARDILAAEGVAPFQATLADLLATAARPQQGATSGPDSSLRANEAKTAGAPFARADAVGLHRLRDGGFAHGVGLAFGHADARSLEKLAEAAARAGASGLRAAPGRALIAIGLAPETAPAFAAAAERLGFIARVDDPRRHVVACAGAPTCASAQLAARALAPRIAEILGPHRDGSVTIHLSGCTKGCAHPAPAALTAVGTPSGCALVANGSAGDHPFAVVPTSELPSTIANYAREAEREDGHV